MVEIVPIAEEHIESYHRCLDAVARERRYIGLVQAPPLEQTRKFVQSIINNHAPQFVALIDGEVVGWCDILPKRLEGFQHCGELGMGVLNAYRGQRIGTQLQWRTPADIRAEFPTANFLSNNRVVFNIKGNDYRLIVIVEYRMGRMFIRFVGTHAEYDRIDAERI